ncbi:GLPGLI family protein [Lutibacter sp.]|uniref:GLPGLI family protein n=1 Tax=Lutibacter sp. TaxID=1925666 RepID=UPI001A20E598|nr:GLPGLI family protein [Lutibacter sp.]MBI9041873.1 GLPGLI family protein [Lutibacter sp.]
MFNKIKILSIILFLIFNEICSQNINGVAIYGLKTTIDFNKIENSTAKDINILKNTIDDSSGPSSTKFKLIFNNYSSLFYYESNLNVSSSKIDMASVKAKITGKIYSNLISKKVIQQKESLGEVFRIIKNFDDYNWKLTNEKIRMDKYICYKAISVDSTKRNNKIIEAWYTPEIPVNTGPMGSGGLPGLIVVLKVDIFTYYLEKLNLNSINKIEIDEPRTGKEVNKIEYDSIYRILYKKKDQLEREEY